MYARIVQFMSIDPAFTLDLTPNPEQRSCRFEAHRSLPMDEAAREALADTVRDERHRPEAIVPARTGPRGRPCVVRPCP
jgi:hypothetical protein